MMTSSFHKLMVETIAEIGEAFTDVSPHNNPCSINCEKIGSDAIG